MHQIFFGTFKTSAPQGGAEGQTHPPTPLDPPFKRNSVDASIGIHHWTPSLHFSGVHQVFVSAANLAHVRPALAGDPRIEGLARLLLRVAYRLTILAGAENAARQAARADRPGRRRLFLTLVGCGVFGNDPHWVCEALGENEALIRQSGLDVVLGVFDGRLLPRDVRQDLEGLARSMGGTVTKVK